MLYSQQHDFSTVVLDLFSALQAVVFAEVCRRENKRSIEAVPYGRGYGRAVEILRNIEGLSALRSHRGMAVILVGHTVIRKFDDPLGASFDQYQLDLHQRLAGFVLRWSDAVLFVDAPAIVRTEGSGFNQRNRAEGGNVRLIHTSMRTATRPRAAIRCLLRSGSTRAGVLPRSRPSCPDSPNIQHQTARRMIMTSLGNITPTESAGFDPVPSGKYLQKSSITANQPKLRAATVNG